MTYNHKLYLVTHRGLSSGYQTAQVAHALTEFMVHRPTAAQEWYRESNTVVALEVADVTALEYLRDSALANGYDILSFYEPDLDDALTAIAFVPDERNSEFLFDLPTVGTNLDGDHQALLREQESYNRDLKRGVVTA